MSSSDSVIPNAQDSQCLSTKKSSIASVTCEVADRGLYWAQKYKNYTTFIQSIADYVPAAQPWATGIRCMPLVAFQMQFASYFSLGIAAHRSGDKTARDQSASLVIREQARTNDFDLTKLRTEHYIRLLRYTSLFVILTAED